MWTRSLLIALLLVLVPSEAKASHCVYHAAEVIAGGLNLNDPLIVEHDLAGGPARTFLDTYNAYGRVTNWFADHILIFGRPNSLYVILSMFHEDCMFLQTRASRGLIERMLPTPFAPSREIFDDQHR